MPGGRPRAPLHDATRTPPVERTQDRDGVAQLDVHSLKGLAIAQRGERALLASIARSAPADVIAVTITPVAACNDSRALKQAASLARIGFQSVLLEGKRSTRSPQIAGVQLISPELIN